MSPSLPRAVRSLRLPKGIDFNKRNKIEALDLVSRLPDACVRLAFLDPQYRTGLDELKYGNEGSRQIARYKLPQQTDIDIQFIVEEIARVLKPSGHLMLWVDKYAIGQGIHLRYIKRLFRMVRVVDVMAWDKIRMGMGRRTRGQLEYLVIIQKQPTGAVGFWNDNTIRDLFPAKKDSKRHPHAKPIDLIERLVKATTEAGALVLDPCAGGYGVLDVCKKTNRHFIGGDLL